MGEINLDPIEQRVLKLCRLAESCTSCTVEKDECSIWWRLEATIEKRHEVGKQKRCFQVKLKS